MEQFQKYEAVINEVARHFEVPKKLINLNVKYVELITPILKHFTFLI